MRCELETRSSAYAFLIGTRIVLRAFRATEILNALANVRRAHSRYERAKMSGNDIEMLDACMFLGFAEGNLVHAVGLGHEVGSNG